MMEAQLLEDEREIAELKAQAAAAQASMKRKELQEKLLPAAAEKEKLRKALTVPDPPTPARKENSEEKDGG